MARIYEAKNPNGVKYKIAECRYFLDAMIEREKGETDVARILEFGYNLSAFMSAFRSIIFRLRGVAGRSRSRLVWAELETSHPEVVFLKEMTDFEVHGDGPTVLPHCTVKIDSSVHVGGSSRWPSRLGSRFGAGRFHPLRSRHGKISTNITGWYFKGAPHDVIELCKNSLDEMGLIAERELTAKAAIAP